MRMTKGFVSALAAMLLAGCLPATGTSDTVVSPDGSAAVTLTLIPDPHPGGRPRSVQDSRTDQEVLSAALQRTAEDPALCRLLRASSPSFSIEVGESSLACAGSAFMPEGTIRVDAAAAASDLWEARTILAGHLAAVAAEGYTAAPVIPAGSTATSPSAEESADVAGCEAGELQACERLYASSPAGSWQEVQALLGLRDDLTGTAPTSWPSSPLQVTYRVEVAGTVTDHNGTLSGDGTTVSWVFEVERPGEVPENLFLIWDAPEEDQGTSRLLSGLLLTLIVAAAGYGLFLTARLVLRTKARRSETPKVRQLSKPKKRRL